MSATEPVRPSALGGPFRLLNRPLVAAVLLALLFVTILALRRGETITSPNVWDEDGTYNVPGVLRHGWQTLFAPVAGYLVVVPKLISLAASISATQFPLINALLAWAFAVLVGWAVAFAPTVLRYRGLAALAVFLVPTDPEVFGTGLYTLWWSGILLLLLALWRPDDPRSTLRVLIAVVAGLSSPLILVVAPVLVIRALLIRRRAEFVTAAASVAVAAVQGVVLLVSQGGGGNGTFPDAQSPIVMVGGYLTHAWTASARVAVAAGIVLTLILVGGSLLHRGARWPAIVFGYLILASIGVALFRAGAQTLDPVSAGPRYFFFPYVLLSWFLLWLVAGRLWLAAVPALCVALATAGVWAGWTRSSVDLHWARHLETCAATSGSSWIPVEGSGRLPSWRVKLTQAECAAWLERDPFASRARPDRHRAVAAQRERRTTSQGTLIESQTNRESGPPRR